METQRPVARFAPVLLRFGFVALFVWFGLSQVTNPGAWVAWVPAGASSALGLSASTIVLLNGAFETVGGILLALGLWTRLTAFILSLHLFSIAYTVGYNDIGVRDFALAVSALALSMFGPDTYTLDHRRRSNEA